jgi:chemosensory pili system protein ChpA (sensor histidine kinase/response regulator)
MDLKETLDTRAHEAETCCCSRRGSTPSLQEGLMRTRMVPFERMVPRLRESCGRSRAS